MKQRSEQKESERYLDIPGAANWCEISTIHRGDSQDRKLAVKDSNGHKFLIRLFEQHQYGQVKSLVRLLRMLQSCQLPVPYPADFGFCAHKSVYLKTRWIEGETLPIRLPAFTEADQYVLGHQTAVSLYALHGCQAPEHDNQGSQLLERETDHLLQLCDRQTKTPGEIQQLQRFVEKNRKFAYKQPYVLLHGDLNADNLIVSYEKTVSLIDFTSWHFGDPLYDIATVITETSRISPCFAVGLLDAYFNYLVTTRVFRLLALYGAIRCLRRYCLACNEGRDVCGAMMLEVELFLKNYNNLQSVVPVWYRPLPQLSEKPS